MAENAGGDARCRLIWEMVALVPYGKVASYGQIASFAGLPGRARLVGYALNIAPKELQLPWHRIINAQGKISLPQATGHYALQRSLLEEEGIEFSGERIDMKRYRWQP